MKKPKPYGWELDVEFLPQSGKSPTTLHYRGCSEHVARIRAAFKVGFYRVAEVRPVTEDEWIRAYGLGRM
jgi:hypothetical protein